MTNVEIHPAYNGFDQNMNHLKGGLLPAKAKILIMGTFPPKNAFGNPPFFYYPSAGNHFWNRIDNILKTGNPLKFTKKSLESRNDNVNRKIEFAIRYGIAFMDYFSKITRKNDTSLDSDIVNRENVIENEFLMSYLKMNGSIIRILCTYSLAYHELIHSLKRKKFNIAEEKDPWTATGLKSILELDKKRIEIIQLYPATRSRQTREENERQYQHFIFE